MCFVGLQFCNSYEAKYFCAFHRGVDHWRCTGASGELTCCAQSHDASALVRHALANNPELKFYAAEIAAAKGTLKTAGTMRNPELHTEAGYKNTRDNSGGPSGEGATWSVAVNQTFEYPGRIALRKAIAKHDIHLAELHLQQFQLTLAARVVRWLTAFQLRKNGRWQRVRWLIDFRR